MRERFSVPSATFFSAIVSEKLYIKDKPPEKTAPDTENPAPPEGEAGSDFRCSVFPGVRDQSTKLLPIFSMDLFQTFWEVFREDM